MPLPYDTGGASGSWGDVVSPIDDAEIDRGAPVEPGIDIPVVGILALLALFLLG